MTPAQSRHYNWQLLRRHPQYMYDIDTLDQQLADFLSREQRDLVSMNGVYEAGSHSLMDEEEADHVDSLLRDFESNWNISSPVHPKQKQLPSGVRFTEIARFAVHQESFRSLDKKRKSFVGELLQQATRGYGMSSAQADQKLVAILVVDLRVFKKVKTAKALAERLGEMVRLLPRERKIVSTPSRLDFLIAMIDHGLTSVDDLARPSAKAAIKWANAEYTRRALPTRKPGTFRKQLRQDLEAITDLLSRAPLIPFK